MGLLNHLFGGKTAIAKELRLDAEQRLALWKAHAGGHFKNLEAGLYT